MSVVWYEGRRFKNWITLAFPVARTIGLCFRSVKGDAEWRPELHIRTYQLPTTFQDLQYANLGFP
jgi:hypothetical protein